MKRRTNQEQITVTCLNCGWTFDEIAHGAVFECLVCDTGDYLQDFDHTLEGEY